MPEKVRDDSQGERPWEGWRKPDEDDDEDDDSSGSIRDSAFGGDSSSEYATRSTFDTSDDEVGSGAVRSSEIWLAEKLSQSGLPAFIYYLNPRRYDLIDWIFASGFVLVLSGAFMLFWTENPMIALASLMVMFLAFATMLMCVGIEDILKEGLWKVSGGGDGDSESESFEGGQSFREKK